MKACTVPVAPRNLWMKGVTLGSKQTCEGVTGGDSGDLLSQLRFPKTATRFTIYELKFYEAERDADLLDDGDSNVKTFDLVSDMGILLSSPCQT